MARLGAEQELEYILFSSLPVDLAKALEDDCNGFLQQTMYWARCNILILMKSSFYPQKKKKDKEHSSKEDAIGWNSLKNKK